MTKRYEVTIQHGPHGGGSRLYFDSKEKAIAAAEKGAREGYRNETVARVRDLSGDAPTEVAHFYDENGQTVRG